MPESKQRNSFSPTKRFASEHTQKLVWQIIAIASLVFAVVTVLIFNAQNKNQPLALVLDGGGTFHVGPLEKLGDSNEVFVQIALQATQAIFDRNKFGLENPELVKSLFADRAVAKLNQDVSWQLPDLKARDIRQQASVSDVDVMREVQGVRFFRVAGTLTRAGQVRGSRISDTEPFAMIVSIVLNPRISERGQYPFKIADFRIDQPARPPEIYE